MLASTGLYPHERNFVFIIDEAYVECRSQTADDEIYGPDVPFSIHPTLNALADSNLHVEDALGAEL